MLVSPKRQKGGRDQSGNRWTVLCLGIAIVTVGLRCSAQAANPARFIARFSSGAFVESNALSEWHAPDSTPKIESQPLFDAANPVRWILDRSLSAPQTLPDAFVEMATGDRLPGVVLGFQAGDESQYAHVPPHFLVRYSGPNTSTLEPQSTTLRVLANSVQRIVWRQQKNLPWQPKTVFLRDGSFLKFRSIRWTSESISFLLDSGLRRISLNELTEIHLAPQEFWQHYFDDLATLSSDGAKRLLQLDTTTGVTLTTSLDRTIPRFVGDSKDVNRWLLGTQPAWSLDLVWIWQGTTWARRSFAPHEIILSRVSPSRVVQTIAFGPAKFPFVTNRNIQFGPLRSMNREAGWGLGVFAFSELEFELPANARSFRSEFAIDAAMKTGGCVQPRVLNASAGNAVLFQGPIVAGSESVIDTGPLGINNPADAPKRIVLQVDPVLENRPANADPFNIRDQANWLDPTVEMDSVALKQQLDARLQQQFLAWNGWNLQMEPGTQAHRTSVFAESTVNLGEYRQAVAVTTGAIKLTKNQPIRAEDRWLVVDAVRIQSTPALCKISAKLGDANPIEWDVPVYDKNRTDFRPLIIPLADFQQKKVAAVPIELRQLATADRVFVQWRAIVLAQQHPFFYRLLEDTANETANTANTLANQTTGTFDSQEKFAGSHSYQLPIPALYTIPLKRPILIRERPQLGEYRFIRFAARKQGGGTMRVELKHAEDVERAARYEAGKDAPDEPNTKRLSNQDFSKDWQLFTRDLFGDFGNIDLTALTFQFPDGEKAWIDHIYLGRTQSDFDLIKPTLPK